MISTKKNESPRDTVIFVQPLCVQGLIGSKTYQTHTITVGTERFGSKTSGIHTVVRTEKNEPPGGYSDTTTTTETQPNSFSVNIEQLLVHQHHHSHRNTASVKALSECLQTKTGIKLE